jgi:hypothetical protein
MALKLAVTDSAKNSTISENPSNQMELMLKLPANLIAYKGALI